MERNPVFCYSNEEWVENYLKFGTNIADSGFRALYLWRINHGDTSYVCFIYYTNDIADDFARHGQNQEKEKHSNDWIEWFPFEKFFWEKKANSKIPKHIGHIRAL